MSAPAAHRSSAAHARRPVRHRRRGVPGVAAVAGQVSFWTILGAATSLLVAILTARKLGVAGRGEVVLIVTVAGVGSIVVGAGTSTAARYHLGRGDPRVRMGDFVGLTLALCVPLAVLAAIVVVPLLATSSAPARGPAITLVGALFAVTALLAFQALDALNAVGSVVACAVVNAAGGLLQAVVLLSGGRWSVLGVLVVMTVCTGLQPVAAGILLRRDGHDLVPRWTPRTRAAWRLLLRTGVPVIGLNIGTGVAFKLDRFLTGLFLDARAVGIYSVAATASESLRLIPASWGQTLFPRVAAGRIDAAALRRQSRAVLLAMAVLAGLIALLAGPLIRLFFGAAYEGAAGPLRILLLAELFIVTYQIDARVLAASGRTKRAGAAGLAGLVVVTVLDLALIPPFGLTGASVASVAAYAAMSLVAARGLTAVPGPADPPADPSTVPMTLLDPLPAGTVPGLSFRPRRVRPVPRHLAPYLQEVQWQPRRDPPVHPDSVYPPDPVAGHRRLIRADRSTSSRF